MTHPDNTSPDNTSPDNASSGNLPAGSTPGSTPLSPSPWILLDRTTATQTATVLDRLEQWLAGAGKPSAVEACAQFCSLEESDAFSVAAWAGALAARIRTQIEVADQWS